MMAHDDGREPVKRLQTQMGPTGSRPVSLISADFLNCDDSIFNFEAHMLAYHLFQITALLLVKQNSEENFEVPGSNADVC